MLRFKDKAIADENLISDIAHALGVSHKLAKMLIDRGYDTPEKAYKFINPSLKDLLDPYLMSGMKEAVERIKLAKENGETVVIYGDYDADGISAVTVLTRSLKIFGIDAIPIIPERENGYGLSEEMVDGLVDAYLPDLIITVDCGISAYREVEELLDLGVDVIVTDHHEIPELTPNCVKINCKIEDDYPFDGLCGAGVAYKLATALIGSRADEFLDVVAIATIADSMPLVSDNRIIVTEGLKKIKSGKCNKTVKALANISGMKEISSTAISYTVAPRINAAGRMGDARSALSAFLSDDVLEIENYAKLLNEYNVKRQTECDLLYKTAKAKLSGKSPDNRVIALYDEEWKTGLIGIVAAKLVEEYSKPVILFTAKDGVLHGSARSVVGVNIFKALGGVKDYIQEYGGHAQAAGVSLLLKYFEDFERALNDYLVDNCDVADFVQETEVEELITEKFTVDFAREISLLEPFGIGNKKPVFAVECARAFATPLKFGSQHVSFKSPFIDLLMFYGVDKLQLLNSEIKKTIVFETNLSVFNGKESLKGYVKEISTEVCLDDGVVGTVFSHQLDMVSQKGRYKSINKQETEQMLKTASKEIYGTLFIVNDYNTLNIFEDTKRFNKSVLSPDGKGNINLITLGTDGVVPEGYKKIVYLDKPLSVIETDKEVYVNVETEGFNKDGMSTERVELGKVYMAVKNRPQGFISFTELIDETGLSVRQIVFAIKVFIELGLIIPQSGRYKAVGGIKRDLTDSSVYRLIKGVLD